MNLIDRQFMVNVSLERAWQHLARVDQWTHGDLLSVCLAGCSRGSIVEIWKRRSRVS